MALDNENTGRAFEGVDSVEHTTLLGIRPDIEAVVFDTWLVSLRYFVRGVIYIALQPA